MSLKYETSSEPLHIGNGVADLGVLEVDDGAVVLEEVHLMWVEG